MTLSDLADAVAEAIAASGEETQVVIPETGNQYRHTDHAGVRRVHTNATYIGQYYGKLFEYEYADSCDCTNPGVRCKAVFVID